MLRFCKKIRGGECRGRGAERQLGGGSRRTVGCVTPSAAARSPRRGGTAAARGAAATEGRCEPWVLAVVTRRPEGAEQRSSTTCAPLQGGSECDRFPRARRCFAPSAPWAAIVPPLRGEDAPGLGQIHSTPPNLFRPRIAVDGLFQFRGFRASPASSAPGRDPFLP
jgi:hypothetical protein